MLFLFFSAVCFFITPRLRLIALAADVVVAIAVIIVMLAAKVKGYPILCVALSAIMIASSCLSSFLFFQKRDSFTEYYGEECTVEAIVISRRYDTVNLDGYEILVSKLNGEKTKHKAILDCAYDSVLEPGHIFTAKVTASGFDYVVGSYREETAMLSDGVFISYASQDPSSVFVTDWDGHHMNLFFTRINKFLSKRITYGIGGEAGKLSAALLLGNREQLSDTTVRNFSRAGVSHVLALSGMHMTVIMGALMLLLKLLGLKGKPISIILTLCSVFYLFLTGCSVSAARAVIMLIFVYLAFLFESRADSLTALSFAGVLIVLISPGTVADAGFWMSFAATLGLLVYMPPFTQFMRDLMKPFQQKRLLVKGVLFLTSLFSASLFALIPLVAVSCTFTKELSLFSIPSSAILAVPTELLLLLSLLYLPCAGIPVVGKILGTLITRIAEFMLAYCTNVSELDSVVLSLNYPFAALATILIAAALLYSFLFRTRNVFLSLTPFILSVLLLFGAVTVYDLSDKETVKATYVNVSQQSDMLVLTCEKDAVICDLGNGSSASYTAALNEIYTSRATEIRAVMLTRYSYLHNATLIDLFASERVRQLWVPYPESIEEYYKLEPLRQIAKEYDVDVYVYEDGDAFSLFENASITVNRYSIERSQVPIVIASVNSRTERLTYCSPAFNEAELSEETLKAISHSEYLIFGNRGPLTKTEYAIPEDNDAELIVFADETRAAYFLTEGIFNTTYVLSPEKCHVYITK